MSHRPTPSKTHSTVSQAQPKGPFLGAALCLLLAGACSVEPSAAVDPQSGNSGAGGTSGSGGAVGGAAPTAGAGGTVAGAGGLNAAGTEAGGAGAGGESAGTAGSSPNESGGAGAGGAGAGAAGADPGGAGGDAVAGSDAGGAPDAMDDEPTVDASEGCGSASMLQDSPSPNMLNYNSLMSGGAQRRYVLRLPENYDNTHPHRLILGFHGATNNAGHVAGNPAYFGLYALAEGSTIFIAPEAVGGIWDVADVGYVDDILAQVEADLCIDKGQIYVQGFSQGGAMARRLACERPGVFRAAIGHSAGGLALGDECDPIPYFGSLGTQEGGGQNSQTDFFAESNGCTIDTLPRGPGGSHVCTDYSGCMDGFPVRWCSFDAGHTPLPNDAGQNSSWMSEEVWDFLSQFF